MTIFWHYAIKQFSLYLLFKNFTCTCLHRLLLTMRLWLSWWRSDPTSPSRLNTFQPRIIVTFDHFWHYAIKQFSLCLLIKNFTCTCLHRLLLTMRLWLSLSAAMDPQLRKGALGPWPPLNFLFLYFRGRIYYLYSKKYKVIPLKKKKYIYIYIYI